MTAAPVPTAVPTAAAPPDAGRARRALLWACALDVATFKPGNVSSESAGHGMHAALFVASADAAAPALLDAALPVGRRIEAAVRASVAVAGCNTNLGIVLLAAPLAAAFERAEPADGLPGLRRAVADVLAALDVDDARAAYRGIALADPGGLGRADAQDVADEPSVDLVAAMRLAARRDSIARQYASGFASLLDAGAAGFAAAHAQALARGARPAAAARAAMQRTFLEWLARLPDSHIARRHGDGVAHTVMAQAIDWRARSRAGRPLDDEPGFRAWDRVMKARRINPGTSADLAVASAMVCAWLDPTLAATPADAA